MVHTSVAVDAARKPSGPAAHVHSAVEPIAVTAHAADPHHVGFTIDGIGSARFESSAVLDTRGHAWLAATLPVLMALGRPARLAMPLDAVGLRNAGDAQAMLSGWYPQLRTVAVTADEDAAAVAAGDARGVGCFFSGGVDSFYSVLSHRPEVTHLIFVHGFDIRIEDREHAAAAIDAATRVADGLGLTLIVVRTDVRDLSDPHVDWGFMYHGAALATVATLLRGILHHVIIPASDYIDDLEPWGSHPLLDPLWSSGDLTLVHDGVEIRRSGKIESIARCPLAMENLRVCWLNPDGRMNCGRCEKCLRTMISLRAAGALEACATLPHEIPPAALLRLRPRHDLVAYARDNLAALRRHGVTDWRLRAALGYTVAAAPAWDAARRIRDMLTAHGGR